MSTVFTCVFFDVQCRAQLSTHPGTGGRAGTLMSSTTFCRKARSLARPWRASRAVSAECMLGSHLHTLNLSLDLSVNVTGNSEKKNCSLQQATKLSCSLCQDCDDCLCFKPFFSLLQALPSLMSLTR